MTIRRLMLWGVLAHVVVAGLVAWLFLGGRMARVVGWRSSSDSSRGLLETLGEYGEVPDFSLIERSGRRVARADLLGRVWIANFMYTECKETCPLQSAGIARLQGELAGDEDLRFVSITVDPEHDTPAVLGRYAERYGANPVRWLFLTGEKGAIYHLAGDGFHLGVVDPDDRAQTEERLELVGLGLAPAFATHGSKGLVIHSSRFVLVDRRARIRAYHLPDDEPSLDRLRQNVRAVLRERIIS